jgi:AraC family transcriptional regulator, regulatory protein of adaptative response / methylated-DNA-[protein]-cysteine methyltransferase
VRHRFFGGRQVYIAGVKEEPTMSLLPPKPEMLRALRDKNADYDGVFFTAVKTTGIFCRPSCPSRPNPENVEFFGSIRECFNAGYRPCKRCHPLQTDGTPPGWAAQLMERVEASAEPRVKAAELREMGITPERARRWFKQHYGMSFAEWCRGHRLVAAFHRIRNGTRLDDTVFESGFESHSGFRDAFARTFGQAPGRASKTETQQTVILAVLESPLGPLLAGATDEGVCLLEFTDRRMLETNIQTLRRHLGCAIVPGEHRWLSALKRELGEYFAGKRSGFSVRISAPGTAFQTKVWEELRRIPHGKTVSYEELAERIGQPTARRAVARANGMNRVCILIPCHRVIGKDGTLTGYGGGLWRKRLLLELERNKLLTGGSAGV